MGELLTRRRELILPGGGEPVGPLVYSLENRVVADSEVIDTGISPLVSGANMTILFDMNITKNPTNTEEAYNYHLMSVQEWFVFAVGKPSKWNNNIRAIWSNAGDNDTGKICTSAAGRKRIVVTHRANTNEIVAIGKDGMSSATTKTIAGRGAFTPSDSHLTFGEFEAGCGLPPGTINRAQVYNIILPQEDIDAFFA